MADDECCCCCCCCQREWRFPFDDAVIVDDDEDDEEESLMLHKASSADDSNESRKSLLLGLTMGDSKTDVTSDCRHRRRIVEEENCVDLAVAGTVAANADLDNGTVGRLQDSTTSIEQWRGSNRAVKTTIRWSDGCRILLVSLCSVVD
jgi:hypothetical protein